MRSNRALEGVKSLLILLLSLSAIVLAAFTFLPQQEGGLLSQLAPQAETPGGQTAFLSQTLRPAAFSISGPQGRYALLYHQEDQEAYTDLFTLLAEALSDAGEPKSVTQRQWQNSLAGPGLFCEYLGPVPLADLSRWLSNQENPAISGYDAQRLFLSGDSFYFESAEGYFLCPLSQDLSQSLENFAANFSPNGAQFAFEDPAFAPLRPDSLILDVTPTMPQLAADSPVTVSESGVPGEALSHMLQALSFHPQTNPLYAITEGYAITDGGDTLRIRGRSQISFRQSDEGSPRYQVEGSYLDLCRSLAEQTVGAGCGSARLYLRSISHTADTTTVTFGYTYRGAVISVGEEGFAAQFTVSNGAVTSFLLQPRQYTPLTDSSAFLLPQKQAAATLSGGKNQALRPVYEDPAAPQTLSPFWGAFPR